MGDTASSVTWAVPQRRVWAIGLVLVLLVGCAGDPGNKAPVRRAEGPGAGNLRGPSDYVVVRGDTLYSIAFRAGVDYSTLAEWNGIAPPYVIRPGQRLRLRAPTGTARATAPTPRRPGAVPAAPPKPTAPLPPPPQFHWPATGQIVARFGGTNKGVDFAGHIGDPVVAAADGEVVYAGNGLRGYGNLLILRHGAHFLTAYGHNERLLVREGDRVKARQKIAEIGVDGSGSARLHFEVRRAGTPVDPLRFLPSR